MKVRSKAALRARDDAIGDVVYSVLLLGCTGWLIWWALDPANLSEIGREPAALLVATAIAGALFRLTSAAERWQEYRHASSNWIDD